MKIQVKDIMSAPVVTTTIDSEVAYVRELMERKDVSAIPVVEMGEGFIKVRGLLTLYDLSGVTDEDMYVTEIMSTDIRVVPPDMDAAQAASVMVDHGIHHLIVMDTEGIMGILSSMDYVRLVAEKKLLPSSAAY